MEQLLGLLEAQVRRLEDAGAPDYDLMLDIMDYAMNYPQRCHHPKEDLVFKKLMERDSSSRPLVEDLLQEHETIAESTVETYEALRNIVLGVEVPRHRAVASVRDFITLNRRHIDKEETKVFPLALKSLKDEDWTKIDAAISADDPLFGKTVQKQYRALRKSIVETSPEPL